jgi:hypothetical protein
MEILTEHHRRILTALGKSKLAKEVYFTGGTLLAYQYLRHRYSFDIDIFSDDLLDDIFVTKTMQDLANTVSAKKLRYTKFGTSIDLVHLIARLMASVELFDDVKPLFYRRASQEERYSGFFQGAVDKTS